MNQSILKIFVLASLLISWSCKEKSRDHNGHDHKHEANDAVEVSENTVLYDEVMKIHDEVMPKMQDIHNRKQAIKEKISTAAAEQKQALQDQLSKLEAAEKGMMDWMHNFNPIPDSAGVEKAREYLESEIERVKQVRQDILNALDETKSEK